MFLRQLLDELWVFHGALFHCAGVDVGADDGCQPLEALRQAKLDLVICNAGILTKEPLDSLSFQACREQFEVNSLGPLRTFKAVSAKLGEGSKFLVIGSGLGSVSNNTSGGMVRPNLPAALCNVQFS